MTCLKEVLNSKTVNKILLRSHSYEDMIQIIMMCAPTVVMDMRQQPGPGWKAKDAVFCEVRNLLEVARAQRNKVLIVTPRELPVGLQSLIEVTVWPGPDGFEYRVMREYPFTDDEEQEHAS